jgi:hypothetical protein
LRTCTVSLNKILRELPTVAEQDCFKQKLDHAAREATNYVADLASYTPAVMLDIVQQGFTIIFDDNDSVQVKKESDVSSLPDIDNFLPLATQRNLDFIPRNHITPIAPPPTEHTEKLKGYDLTKWFQFAHVQYLYTNSSCQKTITERKLGMSFPRLSTDNPIDRGLSPYQAASTVHFFNQLANNWSGNKFGRCLNRLLRISLEFILHLSEKVLIWNWFRNFQRIPRSRKQNRLRSKRNATDITP